MYALLVYANDNFPEPSFSKHSSNHQDWYSLSDSSELVEFLKPLCVFEVVASRVQKIFAVSAGFEAGGKVVLSSSQHTQVINQLVEIEKSLESMLSLCESLGISRNPPGFDVKLPPNTTLRGIADCAKDLDTIFAQCPLLKNEEGMIEFKSVDIGSVWFTFSIIGATAGIIYILQNLAEIVDKVVMIRSHWLTCKQQEEEARKLGIADDFLESLAKTHKEIIDKMKNKIVDDLSEEHGIKDPEEHERLRYSFSLFGELMNKGMEVYASIDTGTEVKAAFPPIEHQKLPEGVVKMLETSVNQSDSSSAN